MSYWLNYTNWKLQRILLFAHCIIISNWVQIVVLFTTTTDSTTTTTTIPTTDTASALC
jgi:hypothetical protein